MLVPGGFGSRGWEGKILACRVARERGIPYLGICLGMHVAVSEFARHVCGLDGANSTEMDPETPVPRDRPAARAEGDRGPRRHDAARRAGGRARRGDARARGLRRSGDPRAPPASLRGEQPVPRAAHRRTASSSRARSRRAASSRSSSCPDHPWFVASQFHPEFKSRPTRPAPLFREFVGAALERSRSRAPSPPRPQVVAGAGRIARAAAADVALTDLFLELCAIPSPPGEERAVADRVTARARRHRARLGRGRLRPGDRLDDGERALPAARAAADGGTPIFLCAHLDTVPLDGALEPVVGETASSATPAGTILGADNKAAVAVMVEAARRIVDEQRPARGRRASLHAEGGDRARRRGGLRRRPARGAARLRLRPGRADRRDHPRRAVRPGARGPVPRAGVACRDGPGGGALGDRRRRAGDRRPAARQVDDETTANVGVITGGTARNIVPEWCTLQAEARSHDERTLGGARAGDARRVRFAASVSDCTLEVDRADSTAATGSGRRRCRPARRRRARARGYRADDGALGRSRGRERVQRARASCVNLANGMVDIHTPDEHIAVADLERMVEVTLALVEDAREA